MGDFAELIRAAVPSIEALVPPVPAAELGRGDSSRSTADRLLGALELAVARLDLTAPAELVAKVRARRPGSVRGYVAQEDDPATRLPARLAEHRHPGVTKLITAQVRALLPLDLSEAAGDEAAIIARHGTRC